MKFELHPELQDPSLEKVCEMANNLVQYYDARRPSQIDPAQTAFDLSYMLEYLRLNFNLTPKDLYIAPNPINAYPKSTICPSCNLDVSKGNVCMSVACPYQIQVTCLSSDGTK